jgi:hypothetical protein
VSSARRQAVPAPSQRDALIETAHTVSMRTVPDGATLHASVDMYLREHPRYWRRLPEHVLWSDADWLGRGERLTAAKSTPAPAVETTELAAAAY